MELATAQEASSRYNACLQSFRQQHEWMQSLLQGTVAEESLTLLASKVDEAAACNQQAGWLDIKDVSDFFELQLALDLHQPAIRSVGQVPGYLMDEYSNMNDQQFKAYLQELRRRGQEACEELSHLRQGLKHVLLEHSLFDDFQAMLEDADPLDAERLEPLLENLIGLWDSHFKQALRLMQMADQLPLGELGTA